MSFFGHTGNLFFVVGYCLLAILFVIEMIALLTGMSLMSAMDDGLDADISADGISGLLSWFNIHKVPFMIWLAILIFSFSTIGLIINYLFASSIGYLLPVWMSTILAGVLGLGLTKFMANIVATLIPKNESYHSSTDEFSEYVATVTTGEATQELPARAAFVDRHNTRHSILVKPLPESQNLTPGQQVVLVKNTGKYWLAAPLMESH